MDNWRPKPRQKRLLDAAQVPGLNRSITRVCEEAKVPRSTYYKWLKTDEGFCETWKQVWREGIHRHLPSVVMALIDKARKGDVAAARLIADFSGELKQKIEHSVDDKTIINIELTSDGSERETSSVS